MTKPFDFINSLDVDSILNEAEGDTPDGTYVAVKLSKESVDNIAKASKKMGVPNKLRRDKFHITLIYSRKYLPEFEPLGKLDDPITVTPTKLEIFPTQDGKEQVLVIRFDAPDLVKRHKQIMKEHGATYDYDEYKPHLTLSYNCNGFDVESVDIKEYLEPLEVVEEYSEDLNLNWAK